MSQYYPSYLLLALAGLAGIFTTKVPEDTNPVFFWAVSGGVAMVIVGLIAGFTYGLHRWGERFLMLPGLLLVGALLFMAFSITINLPPYVPGK